MLFWWFFCTEVFFFVHNPQNPLKVEIKNSFHLNDLIRECFNRAKLYQQLNVFFTFRSRKVIIKYLFHKNWIRCLNQMFGVNVVPVSGCAGLDAQPG